MERTEVGKEEQELTSFTDIAARVNINESITPKDVFNARKITSLLPRSRSVADIYNELKETGERELLKTINKQKQTIADLESRNKLTSACIRRTEQRGIITWNKETETRYNRTQRLRRQSHQKSGRS